MYIYVIYIYIIVIYTELIFHVLIQPTSTHGPPAPRPSNFRYITACHRAYAQRRGHNAIHKGCCVAAGNDLRLRNGWKMTAKVL